MKVESKKSTGDSCSGGFPRLLLVGFPRSDEEFPRSEEGFPPEVSARPSDVSLGKRSRRLLILG